MKISVESDLVIETVRMDALRMPALVQALGSVRTEEKIPLYGGGIRKREMWGRTGITTLRDEEEEALSLTVDPTSSTVSVRGQELPTTEREFLQLFPTAQRQIGHAYSLPIDQWLLHLDFTPSSKKRGAGSSVRQLSRITISRTKAANQAPQPMPLTRHG